MTKKRKTKRPVKTVSASPDDMHQAWLRTRQLVETMLEVMEKGIRQPEAVPEQWERLFGTRSSAVANLEKLVQVLVELHAQIQTQTGGEAEPLSRDDLALLTQWLEEHSLSEA
jgi:hypothetical protein